MGDQKNQKETIQLKNTEIASWFTRIYSDALPFIEKKFSTNIVCRGSFIKVSGNNTSIESCIRFLKLLINERTEEKMTLKEIERLIKRNLSDEKDPANIFSEKIDVWSSRKKHIMPKTIGQLKYIRSMRKNDITICFGPAGTGKTYLAVALAIEYLKQERVSRIILTRPAVEAGETLGFLPGDLKEKLFPYLRPLYDALFEMIEAEKVEHLIETGVIEIAPLAYMRGRTLNDSFIILDEAQNSSSMQMKMFLTRLGFNSKIAITGDITQIDLKTNMRSGLVEVKNLLKNIEGISVTELGVKDIIRHHLVQKIINAYKKGREKSESKKKH